MLRRELNNARKELADYDNEFYLHHDNQFVCVFRTLVVDKKYILNVPDFDGYALICRTGYNQGGTTPTKIEIPGIYSEFICGCTMNLGYPDVEGFKKRQNLYGTDSDVYLTRKNAFLKSLYTIGQEGGRTVFNFNSSTKPHTVILVKYKLEDSVKNALIHLEKSFQKTENDWNDLTQNVDLCDINYVLDKCEAEERDDTKGKRGTYNFDNFGP